MDILVALAVVGAVVGTVLVAVETIRAPVGDPKASRWFDLAHACRLAEIRRPSRLSEKLTGRLGSLDVQIGPYTRGKARSATRVTVRGLSPRLAIKREGLGSRLGRTIGLDEIRVGDESFDRALHVQGDERVVRALLDVKMRKHLLAAFGVAAPVPFELQLEGGELRAEFADDVLSGRFPSRGRVRWLLRLAERLQAPPDVPALLARTAELEPLPDVRRRVLQVLDPMVHTHARARTALKRAARSDAIPDIRLQAALCLEGDGFPTLQELAIDGTVEDSVSARAVEALGASMASDQAAITARESLASGRVLTARAAVKALGWGGSAHVPALVAFLQRAPELAQEAASALGRTGSASAEAPLLAVLHQGTPEIGAAAAAALGRLGSAASVLSLQEVAQASSGPLRAAALDAVLQIRSRLTGADPGQLSLAVGSDGHLSLAEDERGRVTQTVPKDPA